MSKPTMSKSPMTAQYCAAYGCNSTSAQRALFRFPKNFERAKIWMKNVRRTDFIYKLYFERRICSLHFKPEDIYLSQKRNRLRPNAIPMSINIPPHVISEPIPRKCKDDLQACNTNTLRVSEPSIDLSFCLEPTTEAEDKTVYAMNDSSNFLTISHETNLLRDYLEKSLSDKPSTKPEFEFVAVPVVSGENIMVNDVETYLEEPKFADIKSVDGVLDTAESIPIYIKQELDDTPLPVNSGSWEFPRISEDETSSTQKMYLEKSDHHICKSPDDLTASFATPSIKSFTIEGVTNVTANQTGSPSAVDNKLNIADFNSMVEILKYNNLVEAGNWERLQELCEPITEKITNNTISLCLEKPEVRSLLLNLNFYSPKAFKYVENLIMSNLPQPSQFCNCYKNIDANPGFTSESFDFISQQVRKMNKNGKDLYFNLVFGEMTVKPEIEWTGTKSVGFVDAGDGTETTTAATLIFVVMVVCVKGSWKIPIGFFAIKSMSAEQKVNILEHSVHAIYNTGAKLVGITFDGCATNISTAKLFGCGVNLEKLNPSFTIDGINGDLVMTVDSVQMIKLIRNTLVKCGQFVDRDNKVVDWNHLEKLLVLLETTPDNFLKLSAQRIKLMFTTQILSNSIADALEYCNHILKIKCFRNSAGTVNFIRLCNKVANILTSGQFYSDEFKKIELLGNCDYILYLSKFAAEYFSTLKLPNGQLLVRSPFKTGFIGIILGLKTIPILREKHINQRLSFSNNHIELFFELIRHQFNKNNFITVRQFMTAYRKLVINKCLPLENLPVLQQNKNTSIKFINSTILNKLTTDDEIDDMTDSNKYVEDLNHLLDLDYMSGNLNAYNDSIITYLSGLVIFRLLPKLKCEECIKLLESYTCRIHQGSLSLYAFGLVQQNSRGKLKIASEDILKICLYTEKVLKDFILIHNDFEAFTLDKFNYGRILIMSQDLCSSRLIFTNSSHVHNNYLIRATIEEYLNLSILFHRAEKVRLCEITKTSDYSEMCLFSVLQQMPTGNIVNNKSLILLM